MNLMSRAGIAALLVVGLGQFACASGSQEMDAGSRSQRQQICLNGVWDFKSLGTSSDKIPTDGWGELRVPSSYAYSGSLNFKLSREVVWESPHAWYRRKIHVPSAWNDGRLVKLKFLHLEWAHKVYVNGKLVSQADMSRTCFDVDITQHVKFGEDNEVAVWTSKLKNRHTSVDAGIIRSVYLMSVPAVNIRYAHAIPSVRNKKLSIRLHVRNESKRDSSVLLEAQVNDNGRKVLGFAPKQVVVPAGKTMQVEMDMPWKDPIHWGFGKYGKPHLYHLQSSASSDNGQDVKFDRFGFREFYTVGRYFYLNGKKITLQGDLIYRIQTFVENPSYLTTYYQGMRYANLNFQRMHTHSCANFDSQYWYEVADELGHLVEAQMSRYRNLDEQYAKQYAPDSPESKTIWRDYVNEHFNHPSLIMWCVDNESFTERGQNPPVSEYKTITAERVKPYDRLVSYVRQLDPTRIVEMHHGYSLYLAIAKGWFKRENFMTFNIHPYGSLYKWTRAELKNVKFDNSVPLVVGEVFDFGKHIDPVKYPQGLYGEQWRRGHLFSSGVKEVARLGAEATVLCSISDSGFSGYAKPGELKLGPWSDHIVIRDESKPGKPAIGNVICNVKVRWPSLSGEGVKAIEMKTFKECGGDPGHNWNWFDPTRPMFNPNIAAEQIRRTMRDLHGKDRVKLGPERISEVVVCFGENGKPAEGVYVHVEPMSGQARPNGVMTDANGTAWFRVWDTGKYLVTAEYKGKMYEKELTIAKRPVLEPKAGYGHIRWITLGQGSLPDYVADLDKGAEFTDGPIKMKDEVIVNGNMEHWLSDSVPVGWSLRKIVREDKCVKSGKYSGGLVGNQTQLTRVIRLTPGQRYRVSGWIYKKSGNKFGQIGIRSGDYKWLIALKGSETPGKWQYVEGEYVATGAERYFYCINWYMGNDGACLFDDISVKEIGTPAKVSSSQTTNSVHYEGPYQPDDKGFLRDWLACGPMPNLLGVHGESLGLATDFLQANGGETAAKPRFGQKVEVVFPEEGYWIPGKAVLPWEGLHSTSSRVRLDSLICEERGIATTPPSNVCGYLACTVISSTDRDVVLAIGSDDGYLLWLNGKVVGKSEEPRASKPDQEKYSVRLRKGANNLMMKIYQDAGEWNAFVRFLDKSNQPVRDIRVLLESDVAPSIRCMTPEGGVQPAVVNDGKSLLYIASDEDGNMILAVSDMQTGKTRVVPGSTNARRPVVSAADGRVAFEKNGKIIVMDAAGNQKVVSDPKEMCNSPSWTDSGRRLAYVSKLGGSVRVAVVDPDESGKSAEYRDNLGQGTPIFSHTGKYVAMTTADKDGVSMIKVIASDGKIVATLNAGNAGQGGIAVRGCYDPVFSPDERVVVYVRAGIQPVADLYCYDLETGRDRRLTYDGSENQCPAFSTDGRWLMFAASRPGQGARIYRMPFTLTGNQTARR